MEYNFVQDLEIVLELTGLSTEDFAEELGVSRMTVNNWLTGKKEVSDKNIASFYEYTFRKGIRLNLIKEQLYREELTKPSEVLLFHGAKTKIEGVLRTDCSKRRNDFGPGFYCGESLEQSAMFVATYPASSLYMLRFDRSGLVGTEFGVSRDWMLLIAYFRERLGEYADSVVIQELVKQVECVDYIVAPIADNRMFEIIDQFIDGEITDEQCRHCLSATNLGKQYVFVTEKALRQVELLERCFLTREEKDFYLFSRQTSYEMNRDKVKVARRQYRDAGKYIEEMM